MQRRWSTTQNFFLVFIDELEKQIIIKKNHTDAKKVGHTSEFLFDIY